MSVDKVFDVGSNAVGSKTADMTMMLKVINGRSLTSCWCCLGIFGFSWEQWYMKPLQLRPSMMMSVPIAIQQSIPYVVCLFVSFKILHYIVRRNPHK